jgi:hypothetical protein
LEDHAKDSRSIPASAFDVMTSHSALKTPRRREPSDFFVLVIAAEAETRSLLAILATS